MDFAEASEDEVLEEFTADASSAHHQYSCLGNLVSNDSHLHEARALEGLFSPQTFWKVRNVAEHLGRIKTAQERISYSLEGRIGVKGSSN
jgi:hypothetical protein